MPDHPLDGARKRIERADRHLREVIDEIDAFRRQNENCITVEYDPKTKNFNIGGQHAARVPQCISLPVGDCIYNFRAALDYIIYELAIFDQKGKVMDGTQFPIDDLPAQFQRHRQTYLNGLTEAHKDIVETYQPYNGVDWTKTLRTISNPDKHRHLTVLGGDWLADVVLTAGKPGSFKGRPGKVFEGVGPNGEDVHMERAYATTIGFSDGLPVIETLQNLKAQVADTIDAFVPEFNV